MTENELLSLLNDIGFSDRYWAFCDRFPIDASGTRKSGRKEDILAAFNEVGVTPECHALNSSYVCDREIIGGMEWSGVFVKQRSGLELIIDGESQDWRLGSNFAVLAYDAKQLADPSFKRDPFKGPPTYPRPDHNGDSAKLKEIVKEFLALLRAIKSAIRSRYEGEQSGERGPPSTGDLRS